MQIVLPTQFGKEHAKLWPIRDIRKLVGRFLGGKGVPVGSAQLGVSWNFLELSKLNAVLWVGDISLEF